MRWLAIRPDEPMTQPRPASVRRRGASGRHSRHYCFVAPSGALMLVRRMKRVGSRRCQEMESRSQAELTEVRPATISRDKHVGGQDDRRRHHKRVRQSHAGGLCPDSRGDHSGALVERRDLHGKSVDQRQDDDDRRRPGSGGVDERLGEGRRREDDGVGTVSSVVERILGCVVVRVVLIEQPDQHSSIDNGQSHSARRPSSGASG